ncbi:MAG: LysM peptidoglycan-binding domain-containing protein [Planctomycetota bacterium]|nr:LysM peptidoglycan-binding domain-containing protein [Planctomycetota bacterium]
MGKVEKVIVLSVLFLVALILVVTVTVDDPLDKTNVVEAGAKKGAPAVAQAPAGNPAAPLLNTTIQPTAQPVAGPAVTPTTAPAAPVVQQPAAPASGAAAVPAPQTPVVAGPTLPPGALLKKVDGLQDSWFPDLKLYTWKEGDTWRGIADTYYGDWQRLDVLKRHNEGRMDVQPGESVFVPVFADERAMAAAKAAPGEAAEPAKDVVAKSDAKSSTKSGSKGKAEPKAPAKASGKKFHTVASGESLWKIAKTELGDGNRWQEIYDANRDLLAKPESIKKGMRLRIP